MESKPLKPRKCCVCAVEFVRNRSTQRVCGLDCARIEARRTLAKMEKRDAIDDRKRTKERLAAMKPLSHWTKQAQAAFNAWVRFRDISAGHGCIDCGKPFPAAKEWASNGGIADAGHYLSRGSAPHLKFDERNVFAQLKSCNRAGGATRADMRAGVVARIGLAAVEALEADQTTKQYRAEDLKAITADYRARLKALQP